ncbi:uL15 family ribosomal protein [Thermogladius sp. 4427co]|uniref:uL15 family ribosomal protein n=1 Tax=Thermogladius sp. 4427co TaxID=3450718 RepID=UPI003F79D668
MVVRKRKKSRKLRGRTRTMGWGRVGQHRKSGSRGGFGAVGMHKHKWIWMLKYAPNWYGKHGFTNPTSVTGKIREVNVGVLDEAADKLVREGKASVEGGLVVIDVRSLGFNKVTGKGRVTKRLKVITEYITEAAKKKIEEAGGVVEVLKQ